MGASTGAGADPQRSIGIATASKAAVASATIQKISVVEKNTSEVNWNWRAAGAREDSGYFIHRLHRFHRLEETSSREKAQKKETPTVFIDCP